MWVLWFEPSSSGRAAIWENTVVNNFNIFQKKYTRICTYNQHYCMHKFCKSKHIFLHRCHSVWKMYQISNIFGISLLKLSLESVKGQKFKTRLIFMTYLGLNYKSFISTLSKNQFFFFKHIFCLNLSDL